jgi:hypothetical protein
MPRKPVADNYLYAELADYVAHVEREGSELIESLKIQIAEREAKMRYQKSKAIMHALKSGLSVYGAAKAAGIKSSAKRLNLISDAESIISECESGEH